MKQYGLISIALSILTLTSCESYFDLEGLDPEQKLVIYCMPAAGCDTTVIQLSKTVPVTAAGVPPQGIADAYVDFTVNGEKQTVRWAQEAVGMVPEQSYYVVKSLKTGDRIGITAEVPGLTPVTSASTVPEKFPLVGVTLGRTVNEWGDMLQFRVTFRDDASTDDYYGIRVIEKESYYSRLYNPTDDKWSYSERSEVYLQSLDVSGEPLLNNKVGLDATFDFDYNYSGNLFIWSDEKVSGQEYTLRVNTSYRSDSYSDSDLSFSKTLFTYKVCLYRLSPELYAYLKSVNDIENNELGKGGLAPIRSHYSNIENGFGFLGACNLCETEWLENANMEK